MVFKPTLKSVGFCALFLIMVGGTSFFSYREAVKRTQDRFTPAMPPETVSIEPKADPSFLEEDKQEATIPSVCLDPGHGGDDPGAVRGKVWERDINLIVAQKVKSLLEADGYIVYMTRTMDSEGLSKQDRYSFCNNHQASILVAVHHNSYSHRSVNYSTALYYTEQDQRLAESIVRSTSKALKLENKGIAWFDNSVLSKAKMPAVFSEAFFMTNSVEYTKLAKSDYSRLDLEAKGIAEGIKNYFADPRQFEPTVATDELRIDRTDW